MCQCFTYCNPMNLFYLMYTYMLCVVWTQCNHMPTHSISTRRMQKRTHTHTLTVWVTQAYTRGDNKWQLFGVVIGTSLESYHWRIRFSEILFIYKEKQKFTYRTPEFCLHYNEPRETQKYMCDNNKNCTDGIDAVNPYVGMDTSSLNNDCMRFMFFAQTKNLDNRGKKSKLLLESCSGCWKDRRRSKENICVDAVEIHLSRVQQMLRFCCCVLIFMHDFNDDIAETAMKLIGWLLTRSVYLLFPNLFTVCCCSRPRQFGKGRIEWRWYACRLYECLYVRAWI